MHLQVGLHQNPCTSFTLINHPAENHPALFSSPKPQHGKGQSLSLPWDESHKAQQPQPRAHVIPPHLFHTPAHLFPAVHGQFLSAPPPSFPEMSLSPQRAASSLLGSDSPRFSQTFFWPPGLSLCLVPSPNTIPKSETGSFSVDSQMATAFNIDYMGFATITASVGIGSSGRSGQPKQQNLSWLHMRVDIWLPLTLSTGQ